MTRMLCFWQHIYSKVRTVLCKEKILIISLNLKKVISLSKIYARCKGGMTEDHCL